MNDYLKKITWNKDDVPAWIQTYLMNMRVVVLLIIALIVGGLVSYKTLPQTVAPEINLTMLVVSAALPGSTPEDVESLLSIPLENELKAVDGVDTVRTTANNGVTTIVMTFVRGIEKNRALADAEAALNRVGDLPADATEPRVEAVDFEDYPVVQWAFASDSESQTTLEAQMQNLIDLLEADQKVDRVVSAGQSTQEVQIIISAEQISALGMRVETIRSAVSSGLSTLPSGTVQGSRVTRSLSIDASVESVDDLRFLPVTIGEMIVQLGDIAAIVERPAPGTADAYISETGDVQKVVTLDIYRTSGVDLSDAVARADEIVTTFIADTGGSLTRYDITNADTDLSTQFNDLMRNLSITVALVFVTLMLFVGVRQAFLASVSIPLIYAIAFISMQFTGISVNFLSLFSLMISLGLLVDVTIVIVSAMTTYMREGSFGARKTGVLVFRDFFLTLVMTTLTTVWAFVPLLLAGGIIGEYIKPIPVVVSTVLGGSVFVGFFVILPLMIWLFDFSIPRRVIVLGKLLLGAIVVALFMFGMKLALPFAIIAGVVFMVLLHTSSILWKNYRAQRAQAKSEKPTSEKKVARDPERTFIHVGVLQKRYEKALSKILLSRAARWKTVASVTIFFIFGIGLVAGGYVKNVFFPGEDADFFYVAIELPEGTKTGETEGIAREFLPTFSDIDGVDFVTMQVGFGVGEQGGTAQTSDNEALFTFKSPKVEIGSQTISEEVRNMEVVRDFTAGKISVIEAAGGPPAGADVTITFIGAELDVLRDLGKTLEQKMTDQPVENIAVSPGNAAAIVAFEPDDYLLAQADLSRQEISSTLRLLTSGITLAEDVEFEGVSSDKDILLRMSSDEAILDDLGNVTIQTENGLVPLDALGTLVLKENITQIVREDYDRTVTVTAAVKEGANAGEVNAAIGEMIDAQMSLPQGYTWKTGGANEENNESVASIIQGMGLAAALIFLTLIIHLRSYRKAAIVLLTIPLAITGVFVIFGITGIPLSFPALIGVLALFGIVVNNAIIIIAQINANREVGIPFHQAVVDGSASRLEPILLSSLTTIIGLTPITLSDPLWQGLGGAIISGLLFSGSIMLFFIPTVYYMMMSDERS